MVQIKLHAFSTQVIYFVTTLIIILNHCRYKRGAVKPVTLCAVVIFLFLHYDFLFQITYQIIVRPFVLDHTQIVPIMSYSTIIYMQLYFLSA